MSAKRPLDDAETDAGAAASSSSGSGSKDITVEPYSSYMDVHAELVSLKAMPSEQAILAACKRAQLTILTTTLPLAVQQISVRLVCQLCTHPATNAAEALACLVQALGAAAAAPSVRCEIYQTLAVLHELKGVFAPTAAAAVSLSADVKQTLDRCVLSDLNHSQHHLRCSSLAILAQVRPQAGQRPVDVFDTASKYTADAHPKVRQTALLVLLRQHMLGMRLPVDMYDECVVATKDDSEQVRLAAIELLWAVSSAYPEHPVEIRKHRASETIRLLDDAFVKTCDMVNDSSVVVRQRACTVLGRFKRVDGRFLAQTFSKQVMSNLRRYAPRGGYSRGYAGRNRGVRGGGGGGGGHSQGFIPTPKGDLDVESDEFRLLDSGAAGAFVHGLEDEYQEVRDAAIESLTELSTANADFAAKSVDFLVDMFNDSSDRVRLCAVRALASLGERSPISLTDEQLSIALSAMKDASHGMRTGIYAFLALALLPQPASLAQLARALAANLERYCPEDQMAIYRALAALGRSHAAMVTAPFVRALMGLSEHYLSREARIDDIAYAGHVILVMNSGAANNRRALGAVLPDYVYSHLSYIRDKYPACLPEDVAEAVPHRLAFVRLMLERPHVDDGVGRLALEDGREAAARAFAGLQHALASLCRCQKAGSEPGGGSAAAAAAAAALDRRIEEFARLAQEAQPVAAATTTSAASADATDDESAHQGQQTLLRYARLVHSVLQIQQHAGDTSQRTRLVELASQLMYGAYAVEARTMGLSRGALLALRYLRLMAHAAWMLAHPRALYDPRVVARMAEEMARRARRVEQMARAAAGMEGVEGVDVAELRALSDGFSGAEGEADPADVLRFVAGFRPLPFLPASSSSSSSAPRCQYAQAHFAPPAPGTATSAASSSAAAAAPRRTIEYNHQFPLSLHVQAQLTWVARRHSVRLVVRLPTQRALAYCPSAHSLRPLTQMHWALDCPVVPVALPLGSGECTQVSVHVALRLPVDVPWSDAFIVRGDVVPMGYAVERYYKDVADERCQGVDVVISEVPFAVKVNPVEVRPPPSAHTRA
ncbi:hypothetical protein LPJ53_002964 [Coemansia erecta]|uniref:ARM repeat-containing protein n=1 Tax=Coemansia erecta TaxID=147472 RepID=A0A9W8CT93_9FUNG|nr:hypothetical protein LPJ53_002964 [Coemansia erecta]